MSNIYMDTSKRKTIGANPTENIITNNNNSNKLRNMSLSSTFQINK